MPAQRRDEERKRQIRSAATRCFVKNGYAATRLLDIAREAGLSKGGIYFHYKAKEQIFNEIVEAHLDSIQSRWSFEPVPDAPADRTLSSLLSAHLRTMEARPDETRIYNLLVTMAGQDPSFRAKLEETTGVLQRLYAGLIRRGIREGVLRTGDPERMASMVVAALNGLAALSTLNSAGGLPIPPEEAAENVLRMLRPVN